MKDKYNELLNELVIFEKKYLLYSHGHEFLDQAGLSLLKIINGIHNLTPKIRITALGNNLVINDVDYGENNPKAAYLSQSLGGRGIYSITLNPGVELDSILDFLYFLNAIPNKSNLLYHPDIQLAMHNISLIEIEEMDYSSIRYGYDDKIQIHSADVLLNKTQLYEALKNLDLSMDSLKKDELIYMAMEEIIKMPQEEVSDFIAGLPDDVISEIIKILRAKENSISPSLIDLLVVLDSARRLAGDDILAKSSDGMSDDQVNKLMEREAYELYVSGDYRQQLQSLSGMDTQSLDGLNKMDLFDKVIIDKTIVMALIHLTKNEIDTDMYDSFVGTIYYYIDELLENGDWYFIYSILDSELISSYLKQKSAVYSLSEGIKNNNSYKDKHVLEVLKVSGPKNISWLIDLYIVENDVETRTSILAMILLFGDTASVETINKIIGDPTQNVSLLKPIIENNFEAIPRVLLLQLLGLDVVNAKLLAIKILLMQNDKDIKDDIVQILQNGKDNLVFGLLDLIREYKITECNEALISRIRTLYISEDNLNIILKTIDTLASIDDQTYRNLSKRLMRKRLTLSPKKLKVIKKHLIGASHDKRFR